MPEAVIVAATRTPTGKAPNGALRTVRPDEMAATVIAEVLRRAPGLEPAEIDDVILGCAMPEAEQGLNVARIASLRAGLPVSASAVTVNRFCSSGLEAIASGAERIMAGFTKAVRGREIAAQFRDIRRFFIGLLLTGRRSKPPWHAWLRRSQPQSPERIWRGSSAGRQLAHASSSRVTARSKLCSFRRMTSGSSRTANAIGGSRVARNAAARLVLTVRVTLQQARSAVAHAAHDADGAAAIRAERHLRAREDRDDSHRSATTAA